MTEFMRLCSQFDRIFFLSQIFSVWGSNNEKELIVAVVQLDRLMYRLDYENLQDIKNDRSERASL